MRSTKGVLVVTLLGSILAVPTGVAAPDAATAVTAARGKEVYLQWCEACHGAGDDRPGTTGLQAKYGGRLPARLEDRTDLNAAFVKSFVRGGYAMMAPFRKTEIGDEDLAALTAYLTQKSK